MFAFQIIFSVSFAALLLFSANVNAEWINVATYRNVSLYVDTGSIRKKGELVKLWSILDLEVADKLDGVSYMSMKTLNEFDCKLEMNRMLYSSYHTENMGEGVAFSINTTPDEMAPVPPNSGNSVLWKVACGQLLLPKIKKPPTKTAPPFLRNVQNGASF